TTETFRLGRTLRPAVFGPWFRRCFACPRCRYAVQALPCPSVVLNGPFALALTAGMVATVNPCGFALLPAYLSAFIGMKEDGNRVAAVSRALGVSFVLTAGFVTVFGLFGIALSPVLGEIQE